MTESLHGRVDRFDPEVPIEAAWTPPSSWYTDADFFAFERNAVFRRTWHPVAHLAALATPGCYASGCIVDEPWVAVHGDDGVVRAFANTCRHKGREVVRGSGRGDRLVCGYHAWTYDLRGRLRSAPRIAGIRDFDRDTMSLPALGVETWGPWIFVSPDARAPSLRARIHELDAMLVRGGWEQLRFVARRSWTLACNWKVYVDNYLDGGYHVPHMHPSLDAQIDMASYRTELFGEFSIQTTGPTTIAAADLTPSPTSLDPSRRIGDGALYAWVYPNFMVNRYGPCMDTNLVIPLGPERCRVDYEFFFLDAESADRTFIEQSIEQAEVTQREDIEICESVQVGLRSSSYDRGRYAPEVEQGEHHFHRLLAADLRRGLMAAP